MATSKVLLFQRKIESIFCFVLFRLITWPEVRMSIANAFLSQGHRATSANKIHSKDDWLRQVKRFFFFFINKI